MNVVAKISIGELIDKIKILKIKKLNINDESKLIHVVKELKTLLGIHKSKINNTKEIKLLENNLMNVNKKLWIVEDKLRILENKKLFNKNFIILARSVYKLNDKRADVKNKINLLTSSSIVEVKSYVKYK